MRKLTLAMLIHLAVFGNATALPDHRYAIASDEVVSERVRAMDSEAILEAGRRGLKNTIPSLEELAANDELPKAIREKHLSGDPSRDAKIKQFLEPQHKASRRAAKMALARMGETKYLKEFVNDLSSSDGWKRIEAIRALGYIGDRRAAWYLGPILNEKGGPPSSSKDDLAPSYSETAEQALSELFPEVQAQFQKKSAHRFYFDDEWKMWWKQNRDKFSEGIR